MADKALTYVELAQATTRQITSNYRSWTAYLMTASRLYKYPYSDQLLIHAQRPDATACAEYDLWDKTMHRYVRRGSKGIALLENRSGDLSLHYVFDVSDTGRRKTSLDPFVWSINLYNELAITAMLEQEYGVSGQHGLPYQLAEIAQRQAVAYWQDHQNDIFRIVDDSYLAEYDEISVGMSFRKAAAISINYTLQARCGFDVDSQFENEDFLSVFDWNTPEAVAVLGTAISQISGQVLRQIERMAKAVERSLENERTELHPARGLPELKILSPTHPRLHRLDKILKEPDKMLKLISCEFDFDTACVELRFTENVSLSIDCDVVEQQYAHTVQQRCDLDYLVYNAPLEYAQLVLSGKVDEYLRVK